MRENTTFRPALPRRARAFAWALLPCALLLAPPPVHALGSFSYRKAITFNGGGSGVVGGPLTDFPVLISLVDPQLQAGVVSPNGYDIVFRGEDGATCAGPLSCSLAHEIESWDGSTGTLRAWVRVPSLSAGTIIYVYYGDAQTTSPTATSAAVWDSSYVGVWHLGQTGSGASNEYRDSSVYGNHGRGGRGTALAVPTRVNGQIGFAQHFDNADGTWDFIDAGDDGTMNITGTQITLEAWVRHNVVPSGNHVFGILNHKGYYDGYSLWMQEDPFQCNPSPTLCLTFNLPGQTHALKSANALAAGGWHHVVATYDAATMRIFVDGAADANTRAKTGSISPSVAEQGMWIGQGDQPQAVPWSAEWNGDIDEMRISRVARSANWIQTQFNNQSAPGSFYGVGPQDTVGAPFSQATPTVNYRSIGATPDYVGTLVAVNGSPLVNDATATWKTANRGRGDRITINAIDYTVAWVNSETQLRLTTPFAQPGGSYGYTVARKFGSPGAWEDCIDGPGGAGCEGVSSSSLVADNRSEVGIIYYDGSVYGGLLTTIDGSTTDAGHTITLTVDPGNRHPGRSGASPAWVAINNTGASPLVRINDGNVTVEWLDLFGGFIGGGPHGIEISSVVPAGPIVIRNNVIHGNGTDGIRIADPNAIVDVYNNMIYETGYGVHFTVDMSPAGRVNIHDNTIYSCNAAPGPSGIKTDVRQTTLRVDLSNNIVHSNANGDIGIAPWFDRAYFCDTTPTCTQIGNGGVLGPTEYLADRTANYTLNFAAPGYCFYLGSTTPFRGLSVDRVSGASVGTADLAWSYWNGATWTTLQAISACPAGTNCPFADGTDRFQWPGSVYWADDPPGWATTSVSGSPALYYVRTCLASGAFTTPAVERQIARTDVGVASRNNLTSDATATPHSLKGGGTSGLDSVALASVNFVSTTVGSENLHLQAGSAAVNTAADLGARLSTDIDSAVRVLPWDVGADDLSATTAVTLASLAATAADRAVDLAWTTASELQNLGFHVYRADSAAGPYTRITSSLIPGLGSSPTGQEYSYRDPGLVNGQTYYYQLEDVETTGQTERHGPVSATPGASSGGSDTPPVHPAPWGTSYGDPSSVVLREVERSPNHVVLELLTGGFEAAPAEEGHVRLRIPGFESVSGPGEPSLPARRRFVEAASGRKVRLASVIASDDVRFPGLRPVSQGMPGIEVSEEGIVLPSEEKRLDGPGFERLFPSESALLLGSVFQRETKKAEVLLFPLRWDGSGLTLSRRLLVRLEFTGVERQETSRGGSLGRRWVVRASHARSEVFAQMAVKERGLYRVGYEDLFGTGPGGGRRPRGILASSLRLSRQGKSVAFHVEPAGALFGPGSSLYFLSEGSSLNPYGDAVYELETSGPSLEMGVESLTSSSGTVSEYFQDVRLEENHYYQAGLLEAPDPWLWDLVVSPGSKSFRFSVTDLAISSSVGRLSVEMQGASDFEGVLDHHVRVSVNGRFVGETVWDGKQPTTLDLELEPGVLQEGPNTLELEDAGDAGAAYSMVFLNRFSVSYPRQLVALQGTLEGRFAATGLAEIQGASAASLVLETTDVPRWLTGATATPSGLRLSVEAGKSYLVTSNVLHPTVKRLAPSGLKSTTNRADYLLLAPRSFLEAARPLLELRESQGLVTKAVSVEEVYEQFGHGEEGPEGIKEFLEYAYHFWSSPSPRYVLLLGDASYDPKDYLGTGVRNWVPPFPVKTSYLWTVSDLAYASVNGGDLLPDVAIGRLPAGSVDEALKMVEKTLSYENGGGRLDGPAVLVADNSDLAGDFEENADEIASTILASRTPRKIYYSREGAGTRTRIEEAFDEGASLMSYVGHGGTVVWASENIFNYQDVRDLALQPQQPLLMTMNCLNGLFHFPPLNSLSEELLKAEGKGVIGAFSPSGLSVNDAAHLLHKALLEEIVSGRHERMGDAILAAEERYAATGAFPELLSIYHLLGDPALRIR